MQNVVNEGVYFDSHSAMDPATAPTRTDAYVPVHCSWRSPWPVQKRQRGLTPNIATVLYVIWMGGAFDSGTCIF